MTDVTTTDEAQIKLWNGSGGQGWVAARSRLDRLFQPFEDQLVESVSRRRASRVLDIGSGTGGTTLAIARAVGSDGKVVGVDISQPMLDAARARLGETDSFGRRADIRFLHADAADYPFEGGAFDMIVSRFGVMFFSDPVRAFANIRRAACATASMHCIAWRKPEDNPFMTAPVRAAAPLLPAVETPLADAPGQFGLADPGRARRILDHAGWAEIAIDPLDVECVFSQGDLDLYLNLLGPLGRALKGAGDETRSRVIAAARRALQPFWNGDHIRFTAACWSITAKPAAGLA